MPETYKIQGKIVSSSEFNDKNTLMLSNVSNKQLLIYLFYLEYVKINGRECKNVYIFCHA